MKTTCTITSMLAAAFLLGACAKEASLTNEWIPGNASDAPVKVTLALNASEVRTVLNGTAVQWVNGDKIQVNGEECTVSVEDGVAVVEVTAAETYSAFYPSRDDLSYADGVYTFTAPDVQDGYVRNEGTGVDGGSFVPGANPMYAWSQGGSLNFHHLFGMVQLKLTSGSGEVEYDRIELRSNTGNTALSGAGFQVNTSTGVLTVPASPSALSLRGIWSTGSWGDRVYHFVVPAGVYAGGLTFDIYGKANPSSILRCYATDAAVTVKAGQTSFIGNASIDIDNPYNQIRYKTRTGDSFSDVTNQLSALTLDGIDELYVEAEPYAGPVRLTPSDLSAIATAVGTCTSPVTLTFNVKLVSDIWGKRIFPAVFAGNTKLGVINMPANVAELAENTFNGCSALTSVKMESQVHWMAAGAFTGCTSLSSLYVFRETPPDGAAALFADLPANGTLTCSNAANYKTHGLWHTLESDKSWTIQ